jgi:F-type H+-transporting ATPase subunit epsilon
VSVTLQVELVSPERILYSGEADMVVCRTVGGGDIAFLTGHAPFVGALDIHPVRIRQSEGGAWDVIAVHGGFVEVSRDRVTVLSDVAELASDIDLERARRAEEQAQGATDEPDEEREAALKRARVRVQVATGTIPGAH